MLKFLRKRENVKKIMWVLALLIIPAFVLWGSGSSVRQKGLPKYAGEIFGRKVSFNQYEASYLACRNQAILIHGDNFNQVAKALNLEETAWERLILLYHAKKEKIRVSDREVIDFIGKMPAFQKDDRFSQDRYNLLLDYVFRTNSRDFEEQIRGTLKINKLREKIIDKVSLNDEEIKEEYRRENEKAKVFYILIEPQQFIEEIHPSYEEKKEYYQSRKDEFKKPDQVNLQYLAFYLEGALSGIEVTEEEIGNYYREHIEDFTRKDKKDKEITTPLEEVKAQIKEVLKQEKAYALQEDKAWQIADEIANNSALFKETAEKNQLKIKETGFFGPQDVIPEVGLSYELLNAAFSMKVSEVSDVIETPQGFFIIKLKEKKESYIPALEEAEKELEQAVIKEKSWQLAKDKGEEYFKQIKKMMQEQKMSFSKAAESLSLAVKETERFARIDYIPGIGDSAEFAQAAFGLKPGEISDLFSISKGYCVLSLIDISPFDEETFTREKETFSQRALLRKQTVFLNNWLEDLKRQANLLSNLGELKNRSLP